MNWKQRYANEDNIIDFKKEKEKRGLPTTPPSEAPEPRRRLFTKQTLMDYLEFMGLKAPTK